jgi:predicted transcriptional regulator
MSRSKTLSILEQAAFIDELKSVRGLSVAEIAEELSVSKSWVSMRLGLLDEMSPAVREKLFSGAFPVYPYMYTLRQFMRMNKVSPKEIEQFVVAVSGKKLSVRDIEQLAHGCFRGPASFRQEVFQGNIALPLARMKQVPPDPEGCNEFERVLLGDLEILQKYMQRVMGKSQDPRLQSRAFHAQCHLLTGGILSRSHAFLHTLKQLHDRNGQA